MKKLAAVGLMMSLVCVFFISSVHAEEVVYKFGALERIRQEIWDNAIDLKTLDPATKPQSNSFYDRNFFRFKTSIWGSADFNKDTGIFLKLTSEIYYNLGPYKQPSNTRSSGFTRLDENEGVIDNLYLKANNLFGLPLDLKVGRQDFFPQDIYGEGFLFSDGTPQDGSRTFYFNAAKLKWRINENHNVDFVYITNQFQDKYLPTWRTSIANSGTYYNKKKILNACDEQAYMVYGRDKLSDNLTVEPYYIFKKEQQQPLAPFASSLDLNTVGAHAVYKSGPWQFGGEFAYQFGEYDDSSKDVSGYAGQDREGYGGYVFGKYKFADMKFKPEFELRFVYLSGDDPDTSKNENFDPLFSRQPYWNELLIYTYIPEFIRDASGVAAYWSNSQLYMAKVKMELSPDTNLSLSYQYWRANEWANPVSSVKAMFAHGYERGHLPTLFLTHRFNKNVDAFFQYEYFIPDNFYADSATNAQFLRWNIQFKI
jgi:Alginate export